jgi:predicted hotdog family 3-hydroxylacyl-ACP dehydratase
MTTLKPCPYRVDEILPQKPPMILIDEVVGWSDEKIIASLIVRRDAMFVESKGAPAHVAVEWMAQTCGALVGIRAKIGRGPVKVGFLLGTRDFRSQISWFNLAERVIVTANSSFNDGEMAVFDCTVERDQELCVTARLTLYQPRDLAAMLASQGLAKVRIPK